MDLISTKFNFKKNYKNFEDKLELKERDIIFCFVGRWNLQKIFKLFLRF